MAKTVDGIQITEANRFSNYVRVGDLEGMRDLERWVSHFKAGGIKAVIAITELEEGDRMCRLGYRSRRVAAVYRVGLEDVSD